MIKKQQKIVIYGKGGIGKSTIASHLSYVYAEQGLKVLHVGCDPKHDSSMRLRKEEKIKTVMDLKTKNLSLSVENIIIRGRLGIDCVECGGPHAGVGCAGLGISLMFDIFQELNLLANYDLIIYDVLGDVVCGGFAAPLKLNFSDKVFIVISEELASLHAALNIAHAINYYKQNGIYLGGLILNLRDNSSNFKPTVLFAKKLNTSILERIPRSSEIIKTENGKTTVFDEFPKSDVARHLRILAAKILKIEKKSSKKLRIFGEDEFQKIFYDSKAKHF
jgi:nitrogenase iron protein NifH